MQRRFRRAIVSTHLTAFFLYFGGTTIAAFAQVGRGTIAGRVTDASGAVLHGARVEILQRNSFVGSDAQGEFTFTDLLPGSYTVTVSYVGFQPSNRDVTVAAGQIARVDAVLKVASAGEEITVYGGRQSCEVEAINRQRTSDNILQVLPFEVITSLPNTEARQGQLRARLIVFSGHIHNYERHEHGGIPFFVTGGGGAHAYPIERDPKDAFQSKDINYHYLLGEVDGRTLKLTMNRLELKNRKAAWTEPDSLTVVAPAARSARTTK